MDIHCNSLVAFDNKVVKTDDGAFGNMVAKTDALHHWATCTSALPKSNRQSLGLLLGTRWGVWKDAPGLLWGPRFESKQTKSWFTFGVTEGGAV